MYILAFQLLNVVLRTENVVLFFNARSLKHLLGDSIIYLYIKTKTNKQKKHSFSSKELKLNMQHFLGALNKSICPAYFAEAAEKTAP